MYSLLSCNQIWSVVIDVRHGWPKWLAALPGGVQKKISQSISRKTSSQYQTAAGRLFYIRWAHRTGNCYPVDVCTLGNWIHQVQAERNCRRLEAFSLWRRVPTNMQEQRQPRRDTLSVDAAQNRRHVEYGRHHLRTRIHSNLKICGWPEDCARRQLRIAYGSKLHRLISATYVSLLQAY